VVPTLAISSAGLAPRAADDNTLKKGDDNYGTNGA